jgi:large subunit ribosomal protein L4
MKINIYNQQAKKTGIVELPEEVFNFGWNPDLVHQVVVSMRANKRVALAHAKTRAEVRGGGRKPWRQKGTGRARHGSIRSPLWVGGGKAHGPLKDRNYKKKINRKMKKKAFYLVLARKFKDNEVLVVNNLELGEPKTKEAAKVFSKLSEIKGFADLESKKKNKAKALFLIKGKNDNLKRAFRNLPGVLLAEVGNLSVLDILNYKYLIFTKAAIAELFHIS